MRVPFLILLPVMFVACGAPQREPELWFVHATAPYLFEAAEYESEEDVAAHQERLKADLRDIQRVVESDEPVDLYPRLREGCRCRVTRGSLVGLEGVVLRRRGMWRVFIGVHFLGQSAELEIDPVQLEILD